MRQSRNIYKDHDVCNLRKSVLRVQTRHEEPKTNCMKPIHYITLFLKKRKMKYKGIKATCFIPIKHFLFQTIFGVDRTFLNIKVVIIHRMQAIVSYSYVSNEVKASIM